MKKLFLIALLPFGAFAQQPIVAAVGSVISQTVVVVDPSGPCATYNAQQLNVMTGHTWGCVGQPPVWTDIKTATGGGLAPTLKTNGVNDGSQSLLNLVAGPNMTLSESGGTVTFTPAPNPTLKTDGSTNSSQTTLNLAAGANVTLSESAGTVTIASSGSGSGVAPTLKTSGTTNSSQSLLNLAVGANMSVSESAGTVTFNTAANPTLKTDGTSNSSQSLLNIAAGSNISLTESGGTVTITGAGSSGGVAPTLKTNGSTNSSQSLLNLAAGSNMTMSESGGTVTFTTPANPTLKTDGSSNSSQSTLNLVAGSNVTLSESGGSVTINSTATGGSGSGIVTMATGAGAPSASCTAPSSSNAAYYTDTTNLNLYICIATNTWQQVASVQGGNFSILGSTESAPSAPASGNLLAYFDSTSLTEKVETPAGAFSTTVFGGSATAHQFLTNIDSGGAQHVSQPTFSDVGSTLSGNQQSACVNTQSGSSYTLASTDRGCYVVLTNSGAVALTVPQATGTNFGCTSSDQCFYAKVIYTGSGTVTATTSTSTYLGSGSSGSSTTFTSTHPNGTLASNGTNWIVERP